MLRGDTIGRRAQIAGAVLGVGLLWAVAIAPVFAQATPMTLNLPRRQSEDYGQMVQRAETAARRAVQQIFDTNPVTEISLTVVGENRNLAAPLLTLHVTREDWLRSPNPRQWSTYYPTAAGLLQLTPAAGVAPTPGAAGATPADPLPSTLAPDPTTAGVPVQPTATESEPTGAPFSPETGTSSPPEDIPTSTPPVIDIPAAPEGQLGLPRSVLR